ncbi:MAG TPA: hypothetical protein DHN33_01895 [Eubacteriaceae bacterium]|nr:hypothetical protein [Eubacteriaceae bacterium]
MNNQDSLDVLLKECLHESTNTMEAYKDSTYKKIEKEIGQEKSSKKQKRFVGLKIASFVAVLFVVGGMLFATSDVGKAAIGKFIEQFLPEKTIHQELEGEEEPTDVTLNQGEAGYLLYIDESRYQMIEKEEEDVIVMKEPGEGYPEVSMSIRQVTDRTPLELVQEQKETLEQTYQMVMDYEKVEEPISSYMVYANQGNNWDSEVVKWYFVDNTKGGTFVIEQKLFLEASEGHGVRFDEMLKEFVIVPEEE